MSMVFVAETPMLTFTENALLVEGADFVVPTCAPVALSFRIRSVIVADSSADRATVRVFTFTPSVAPVESVNEPRRALFVPAIIVWLPYPEYLVSVREDDETVIWFASTSAVGVLMLESDFWPWAFEAPVPRVTVTVSPVVNAAPVVDFASA